MEDNEGGDGKKKRRKKWKIDCEEEGKERDEKSIVEKNNENENFVGMICKIKFMKM